MVVANSEISHIHLPEVDSTNAWLRNNLTQQRHGFVVSTDYQTSGKGQAANKWESERAANLLFSLLLEPTKIPIEQQFLLSQLISISIVNTLREELDMPVTIKWPNDIYIDGKKTGGILLENTFRGSDIHASVAGLGINLNQDHFDELQSTATSLKIASGKQMNVRECAAELFTCLTHRYAQLRKGDFEILDHEYHSKLYRLNMKTQFKSNNQIFSGTIKGVNEQGLLMIDNGSEILNFEIKEVSFLNP